jgi:hypothetical protein
LKIVVLLVVVCALGIGVVTYPPTARSLSALFMPSELKQLYFLHEAPTGLTVYRPAAGTFAAVPTQDMLVSVDGWNGARITRDPHGMYHVMSEGRILLATTTTVVGVTRSPDGNTVAYAIARAPETKLFRNQFELASGLVDPGTMRIEYVTQIGSSTVTVYGPTGSAPVFVDETHVSFVSPFGLSVMDIRTGSTTSLMERTVNVVPLRSLVSPDHAVQGIFDLKENTLTLYRISATAAEPISTLLTTLPVSTYAFGNDALYHVRTTTWGTMISKRALTGTAFRTILWLPTDLHIDRLFTNTL